MNRYFLRSAGKKETKSSRSSEPSGSGSSLVNIDPELSDSESDEINSQFSTPQKEICDFNFLSPRPKPIKLEAFYSELNPNSENLDFAINPISVETEQADQTLTIKNSFSSNLDLLENKIDIMPAEFDKNFALKFIPEFNGARDELHKFTNCVDLLDDENYSAADKNTFLNIIKCKLSGPAYNVVKYKNFNTWIELKAILAEQFFEYRTYAQLQNELVNCKQGPKESVRVYANRIESLLSDLNDVCVANEGEQSKSIVTKLNSKTALKSFVDGLFPSLRIIIKACRFEDLREAIEAAVEEEKSMPQSSKDQKQNQRPNPKPKCSFCHKVGHEVSTCYSKNGQLPRYNNQNQRTEFKRENPVSSQSQPTQVRVVTCNYCKHPGHLIKDCRKRAYNAAKNAQNAIPESYDNEYESDQGNEPRPGTSGGVSRAVDFQDTEN